MGVAADEQVREKILAAADSLFYERGFQSVGIDDIRDRAGVTLKRLYACFPSKDALIEGYLVRRDAHWRNAIQDYVTRRSGDPKERLLLVFDALGAWIRHEPRFRGCAFHNAVGELGGISPSAVPAARSVKHHLREFLEQTARDAGLRHPRDIAFQLLLLAEGALVTAAIDGDAVAPQAAKSAARILIGAAMH